MRCPNISGRVQSGLTSTNSCTAACEAKFSMSVTLVKTPKLRPSVDHVPECNMPPLVCGISLLRPYPLILDVNLTIVVVVYVQRSGN